MDCSLSNIERETYFLIAKFLEDGPCQGAANALKQEIRTKNILPGRTDWQGSTHPRELEEMRNLNGHIPSKYLIEILTRIGPLVEKAIPANIHGLSSVLTAGKFSVTRKSTDFSSSKTTITEATCHHGSPMLPAAKASCSNYVQTISARSWSGTSCTRNIIYGCNTFSKVSMHKRILGHLASVYCVLFDRTGHVIATGADDNLVKLWSTFDGRLLATLRGHFGEISDLAINQENTLIAAGSCDKTIRIWNLHSSAPVAVLQGHTGMITSIEFCPSAHEDARYLMSTGGDGTVCFWKWDINTFKFESTPVKFNEKSRPGAQMLCSSFSPGGGFLVTGSSDNIIRVYQMMPAPPEKIAELSSHSDHVDSIQFNHAGDRFATGSRDGTAMIWHYYKSEWRQTLLNAYQQPKNAPSLVDEETLKSQKLKVTMVGWNLHDKFLVTAVTDHSLKVWDAFTGALVHVLVGHTDEIFVLECHPQEPYIFLSAGHDGNIILWDLLKGVMIKSFFNLLEGQGHGAIFDSRFAPDGMRFAVSDSHGHLCIFGFGSDRPYEKVPYEQFFHTDYRPLIRDANNYVLDEQTQMAPHLMPPPFLVDVDGNPHSPMYQLLIPGRNVNNLPMRRVEIPVADLPPLLAELAAEEAATSGRPDILSPERRRRNPGSPLRSPGGGGGGGGGVGLRQSGDVEGVRQVHSNVFITQDVSEAERHAWRSRVIVPQQKKYAKKNNEITRLEQGKEEIQRYLKEKKRRTLSTSQRVSKANHQTQNKGAPKKRGKGQRAAPRARISYVVPSEMIPNQAEEEDEDEEDLDVIDASQYFSSASDSDWNSSSSSESSDDSDWTVEAGIPAKEPSRESRRRRVRKVFSSCDEEEDEDEEVEVDIEEEEEEEGEEKSQSKEADNKSEDEESINVEDEKSESSSTAKKASKGKQKKPKKNQKRLPSLEKDKEEFFAFYRPPEWITGVQPQKSPYVPQIGDEVYYFRQGHELYVKAVMERKIYEINAKKQCYLKYDLKAEELCRIVKIHYGHEIPRICSVSLAIICPENGANTGGSFSVKYHDMADVLDFFVLRQHYEQAIGRGWIPGDRFRCAIEEHWWSGTVVDKNPFQDEFPDSNFHSLEVRWDTGEEERMSPWDMELLTSNESDSSEQSDFDADRSNCPLTDEDRTLFDYTPLPTDWPNEGRENAIKRISNALEQFSELQIAGAFAFPVDVDNYPDYWSVVPYPTDLNTIRERLVNRFYRRRNSLLWEIRLIELNAKLYNEEKSDISVNSSFVTKLLVSFICDPTQNDLIALYNETRENGGFVDQEKTETDSGNEKKTSRKAKSSKRKKKRRPDQSVDDTNDSAAAGTSSGQSWTSVASELLDFLISREDSDPFRRPVDTDRYPDYTSIVKQPMDFSIIREHLDSNVYVDPETFVRDIRLVFSNSRLYNTNQRSRIYGMTLRLSALFDSKVKDVLKFSSEGKSQRRRKLGKHSRSNRSRKRSDSISWSNISNQDTVETSDGQDSSLRLVLRRQESSTRGLATIGESSDQEIPSASTNRGDDIAASRHASAGHSPRRIGIAVNLRTGRARDLSEESSLHTDSDHEPVRNNHNDAAPTGSKREAERRPKRKRRRIVNPNPLRIDHVQRNPPTESRLEAAEANLKNGTSRSRRNAVNTRVSEEASANYQTRSSRRTTSKSSNVKTESEKENLAIENGVEKSARGKVSRKHRHKVSDDFEDVDNKHADDEEEHSSSEDDNNDNDHKSDNDNYSYDDDDDDEDENDVLDTDNFFASSNDSDPEVSGSHMKTRTRTGNVKRGKASSEKGPSKKRRCTNNIKDSKSRKSKRARLKVNYNENFEEEAYHSDEEVDTGEDLSDNEGTSNIIGVSSRGRVRKAALRYLDYVDS